MTRRTNLALYVVAVMLLAAGSYHAHSGVAELREAQQYLNNSERYSAELNQAVAVMERRKEHAEALMATLEAVDAMDLDAALWEERRLNHDGDEISRRRALDILDSIVDGEDAIFLPQAFAVRVPERNLGLFRSPDHEDRHVDLRVKGALHLRLEGGR